ncbi:MAG: hypothetical protein QN140_09525 [Armatimonadota bacterium]|nr:hypothetical protein [Armatimonadota bacterium]MDR7439122.1 hypothetical protein [Armatimonadota bacterium]MDR7562157.1 hypothetical protein [Armatimonadota bacterium]MDR7567104.1 hypothetical protein [Armatimonadota bacterium]
MVGIAGLEMYGEVSLLRSVATDPSWRNRGIARHFGFRGVPRAEVDPRLQASQELTGACPQTARIMVLALESN